MRMISAHWQHSRLIEGEIPGMDDPLPVITIFIYHGIPEHLITEMLLNNEVSVTEVMRAVPTIRYDLSWYDGEIAYYKMAKRWRD